jgi:hypothetical protein
MFCIFNRWGAYDNVVFSTLVFPHLRTLAGTVPVMGSIVLSALCHNVYCIHVKSLFEVVDPTCSP